jgi:putative intracellular protease/amidase
VTVDGRLVTGQNPQSATAVGEALRDLLLASAEE